MKAENKIWQRVLVPVERLQPTLITAAGDLVAVFTVAKTSSSLARTTVTHCHVVTNLPTNAIDLD